MPQMSPMWWTNLMMILMMTLIMMMVIMYFNFNIKMKIEENPLLKKMNWKW
nr:ATP synthase F0 subunit 8 [Empoascanara gracilis]